MINHNVASVCFIILIFTLFGILTMLYFISSRLTYRLTFQIALLFSIREDITSFY